MKKLVLILALSLCLVGCGYEETREYPVVSTRYYTETVEEKEGAFTTTTNTYEYIEYIYIDIYGEYQKDSRMLESVKIADESKVVEEKGYFKSDLYLTLEDYEKALSE